MAARALILLFLLAGSCFAGDAEKLARDAAKAARAGDYARAFSLYSQAAQLSPYSTYAQQSRAMLAAAARMEQVRFGPTAPDVADRPSPEGNAGQDALLGEIDAKTLAATRNPLPPTRLEANDTVRDLNETAAPKQLWETVLKGYGLDAVFDDTVQDTAAAQLRLDGADYREAIRALELVTNTIAIPVAENLLLVAANNASAQTQLEPTAAIAIPLPQVIANEDATEIANTVRQALEIRTVMVDASRRLLLIRDRYAKVMAAQALAMELIGYPQDVVLEVEFREATRRAMDRFGVNLPTSFPVRVLTTWMNNRFSPAEGFLNYLSFGGGSSLIGIGIASAEAVAFMSRSDSKTIYRAEVRGSSGKESTLSLGQEYPILKSSFLSGPSQQPGSSVFFPQVDFKQIGFQVKAKPVVWRDTVTMDLSVSVSLLTGESSNGIPVLSNRETTTRLRVEDGQWIAVAGLLRKEEARNLSGLAGLNQIPGIGALFRQTTNIKEDSEVLVLIRPRVIHGRSGRMASAGWWTGTSTRFLAPL
ncbi:MAG: type II and III secretion system protein [Bryobacterales bacterium]|nr:type II and III secretion system protein [Bryobacterales bacterium]